MTITDGIVLKGERIVIPRSLRKDVMKDVHSSHIGIEGCLRRARESVYTEPKDFISKCEICNQLNNKHN